MNLLPDIEETNHFTKKIHKSRERAYPWCQMFIYNCCKKLCRRKNSIVRTESDEEDPFIDAQKHLYEIPKLEDRLIDTMLLNNSSLYEKDINYVAGTNFTYDSHNRLGYQTQGEIGSPELSRQSTEQTKSGENTQYGGRDIREVRQEYLVNFNEENLVRDEENNVLRDFKTELHRDRIFVHTEDCNLYVYSINERRLLRCFRQVTEGFLQVMKIPDNKSIYLNQAEETKMVRIDTRSYKQISSFELDVNAQYSVITHDQECLFTILEGNIMEKRSVYTSELLDTIYSDEENTLMFLLFCSLDSKYLLISSDPDANDDNIGYIIIFDIKKNKFIKNVEVSNDCPVFEVIFKKDNTAAYTCDAYGNIKLIDLKTFEVTEISKKLDQKSVVEMENNYSITLANEDKNLLIGREGCQSVFNLEKQEVIKNFNFFASSNQMDSFSNRMYSELINDGKIACVFLNYGDLVIIDLETLEIIDYHGDFLNGEKILWKGFILH